MPRYEVTSPDGKRWEINAPEGASQDEVLAYAQKQWSAQSKDATQPASVRAGTAIKDSIPRQLGLTARYGIEGLAGLAETVTEPIRYIAQKAGAMKGTSPLTAATSDLLTRMGVPQPETADERVVGDASRLVAGTIGGSSLLNRGAQMVGGTARDVMSQMAARPGMAALSAAGSGLAGGSVRESGGGPEAQFAASLAGGIAAPTIAAGVGGAAKSLGNTARLMMSNPVDIDARLSLELRRAGLEWENIGADVKRQLREDAKKAILSGEQLDSAALRRLTDYRNIGATPLVGDITQDPNILTQQRNLSKQIANTGGFTGSNIPNVDNANARRVLSTLEGATSSPLDSYGTGSAIINRVRAVDEGKRATERGLYEAAKDSQGRTLPLDRGGFINQAFENLARENKMAFLPENVSKFLETLGKGTVRVNGQDFPVPFDVNTIDQLKTTLATASRSTQDGNAKAAIKAVRDALENVQPRMQDFNGAQLTTQAQAAAMRAGDPAAASMAAFDKARSFARERRSWQESSKFIEDALSGAEPDNFVKRHIIGADVADLAKLRDEIGAASGVSQGRALGPVVPGAEAPAGPNLLEAVRKQIVQNILDRGRSDSDTTKFSSAGMNDALKAIGDRKLELFFSPQEIQQIKSAVNVGRYMQSQPIGSAVNNSNTAGALLGRMSSILDRASPVPVVGPMLAEPLQGGLLQLRARGMQDLSKGLLRGQPTQPSAIPSLLLPGLLSAPTSE
jgi:hypothetical protein